MKDEHNITLTDDECNVLRTILYSCVGGPVAGRLGRPRKVAESIASKVPWPNVGVYTATIEVVNQYGGTAVVVREAAVPAGGGDA